MTVGEGADLGRLDLPLGRAGIPGLTPRIAGLLAARLEIETVRDLLEHAPRRYLDLSRTKKIAELRLGEEATVVGTVRTVRGRYLRSRKHLLTVKVADPSGSLDCVWWNQPFRAKSIPEGAKVAVAGRVERKMGHLSITQPFLETLSEEGVHTGRIIPMHPATEGVSSTQIRRFVHAALRRYAGDIEEFLPPEIVAAAGLVRRADALREIHFPSDLARRDIARERLVFEELFVLEVGLAVRKRRIEHEARGIAHAAGADLVERFLASLPFRPTGAQLATVGEIAADMAAPRPMNRLLQGEVGSGKTVVALAAALRAAASGSQTAFMAPTEVLAEQHLLTLRRLLEPLASLAPTGEGRLFGDGFEVELLTGSVIAKERDRVLEAVASGRASMVVGTHALIQEGVEFHRLGLAVVDEQHRFGVHQRVALRAKGADGAQPDVLIMTATPIPRTLALTLYGDLDVSVLDELPAERVPIRTVVANRPEERSAAYDLIRSEVASGRQAFIVCPLVDDSGPVEAKAAKKEWERIDAEVFPDLRVDLIHGRMRSGAKEGVMRAMRAGEIDVLVATTVIEVGVDVPNATVMLIEDADRFGLSQLHQLRGRIGRAGYASTCVLLTSLDPQGEEEREVAAARLAALARTNDGFELAEEDLRLRGEGQIFGRGRVEEEKGAPFQAGRGDLRFARLLRDHRQLARARAEAFALVDDDPRLEVPDHAPLLAEVRRRFADRLDWLFAS